METMRTLFLILLALRTLFLVLAFAIETSTQCHFPSLTDGEQRPQQFSEESWVLATKPIFVHNSVKNKERPQNDNYKIFL